MTTRAQRRYSPRALTPKGDAMARSYFQPNYPVEVVARSRRGLLDAVRQALSGASRTMGTLERCEATIMPQIVRNGTEKHFQIMISVTKRDSESTSSH